MTERELTTRFSKFLREHPRDESETYEFKMVKGHRFAINTVKPHQVEGLQRSLIGMWHKISDSPIFKGMNSKFTSQKPFDAFFIIAKRAYVVPIFYCARHYKKAYLIRIEKFLQMKQKSYLMDDLDKLGFETIYL